MRHFSGMQNKRKQLVRLVQGKVLVRLLVGGPQSTKQLVETLRECRFLNYSFWTVADLWHTIRRLKTLGKIGYDVWTCKWSIVDDSTTQGNKPISNAEAGEA